MKNFTFRCQHYNGRLVKEGWACKACHFLLFPKRK
jgi:hypothetical protein